MIEPFSLIVIFCFGLAIGSFLNVVVIRGHRRQSLGGRSHCVHCNTMLSVRELIPIFSFLIQKRRCRHCANEISWQYPLVEFACGLLYVVGFAYISGFSSPWTHETVLFLLAWFMGIPAVLVILVSDLRFQTIPDGATLALGAIGIGALLMRTRSGIPGLQADILTIIAVSGFLFALWFFSQGRWMGFGDVKLILATSLILGFPAAIAALLFAFWSGGAVGIFLLLTGKKHLHQQIPFGPFILLGAALALLPHAGGFFLLPLF